MGLIRLDKVGADTHIVNLKAGVDVVRGNVLKIGAYEEFDVYNGSAPTVVTDDVAFVGNEFVSTHALDREEDSVIKAGEIVRGYLFRKGEMITVTNDLITGIPVINQFVVSKDAVKLQFVATLDGTETLAFVIDDVNESLNGEKATLLRVVKGN